MRHPTPFSDALLPIFAEHVQGYHRLLDPMAGSGKIFELEKFVPDLEIYALELQPNFAAMNPRTRQGNALDLPWPDGFFDCGLTSCTYGNRCNDHYRIGDHSRRLTYQKANGADLHPDNTGRYKYGMKEGRYEDLHLRIYAEVYRVLSFRGRFILNVSDSLRTPQKGAERVRVPVTDFHRQIITGLGFSLLDHIDVVTPRNRYGANGDVRVECEHVLIFEKRA